MKISNDLKPATDLPAEFIEKVRENLKNYSSKYSSQYTSKLDETANKKEEFRDYQPAIPHFSLTREETNLLQSWRLEEYVSIMDRMKNSDPEQYKAHQQALMAAEDGGELGEDLRVRLSAYRWAYGDAMDQIYEKHPGVDVFIKSPQDDPRFYDNKEFRNAYQKKNNIPYLVITTDELKLLQSKRKEDKERQDKLWDAIKSRISS